MSQQQQQQIAAHYGREQPGYYQPPIRELAHDGASRQELAGDGAEVGK